MQNTPPSWKSRYTDFCKISVRPNMPIEFGILEDWSTTSFVPQFRVDMNEGEFVSLRDILDRITRLTGVEFDTYSSATIAGPHLDVFIDEFQRDGSDTLSNGRLVSELLRCARH